MMQADLFHTAEEIAPRTWRISEAGFVNCYLLEGDTAALLIDAGCGAGNLRGFAAGLTEKPLSVAVTHRHPDHVGGAWRFGQYFAAPADCAPVYSLMCRPFFCRAMLKRAGCPKTAFERPKKAVVVPLENGRSFDLGNRTVQARSVPGHTRGSMIFVDEENRLLFTGDDMNPDLWLHLPGCTSLKTWCTGADLILSILKRGFSAWYGHGDGRQTLDQAEQTRKLVSELLKKQDAGELKKGSYPSGDVEIVVRYRR